MTGDIPAFIAWWNVLLPAVGLSSPKPPTAGARRARLYRPMVGSRQSILRSDNLRNLTRRASDTSACALLSANCARVVVTANTAFPAGEIRGQIHRPDDEKQ